MWARFSKALAPALIAAMGTPAPGVQAPLLIDRERVLSLDMRIDPQTVAVAATTGPAGVVWRQEIRTRFPQGPGLDGIRVQVRLHEPPAADWSLRVLDAAGRPIDRVAGGPGSIVEFWSREVPGGVAVVEFTSGAAGQSPGATLAYAHHVTPTEQQAISGPNQLMRIGDAPRRVKQLGKAVARLRFMLSGEGQATCTGFLVGGRLLLTNQHCISNEQERQSTLVDFDYDAEGSPVAGIRVEAIVAADAGLDYSLLRLDADPPTGAGRLYFAPPDWAWSPSPGPHPLLIVQHPSGSPKHASIADCQLAGLDRVGVLPGDRCDFGHRCDTMSGSSGSPVMDWRTGLVVGLHHFGFVAGSPDPVNQAVLHTRILADVARRAPAAHAEMTQRPAR